MLWRRGNARAVALPAAVFLLGTCIAAVLGIVLQRGVNAKAKVEFQASAERVVDEVELRFLRPIFG